MDRLQAMTVFTKVVEFSSFSRTADVLGLPRATVSVMVQQLEAHLRVQLLQRTTRRLKLTPDGTAYYERCKKILADVEETESAFVNAGKAPRGKLRIDMPSALGRMIVMPRIHKFHARFPAIELMLGFGDRQVDLIAEGVDCVIRIGTLQDSRLVARRIGVHQRVTVASPEYLARHGVPESVEDLERHVAVNYFLARTGRIMDLTFEVAGHLTTVRMGGQIAVNNADTYVESGLAGIGIIQAPRFMARPHLKSGKLVEVLSRWQPQPMPISVVYPHNRHLSQTVRVFVDWVAELFSECELLSGQEDSEARSSPITLASADDRAHLPERLAQRTPWRPVTAMGG